MMGIEKFLTSGFGSRPKPIESIDFSGTWTNRLGSEIDLAVSKAGKLTGTCRTNVGTPAPADRFELVGFVTGDLITFTVNFEPHGSLAVWAGQHAVVEGKDKIYTLWQLAKNMKDEEKPENLWAGILAGANLFERP